MNKRNLYLLLSILLLDAIARGLVLPVILRTVLSSYETFIVHPLDVVNYTGLAHLLIAMVILVVPLLGYAGDRYGKRSLIGFCLASSLLSYLLLLAFSTSILALMLVFIALNVRFSLVNLIRAALVDNAPKHHRLPWIMRVSVEPFFALLVMAVTAWLLLYYPLEKTFLIIGILLELMAFIFLYFFTEKVRFEKIFRIGAFWRDFILALMQLLTNKSVRVCLIAFALLQFSWGMHEQYLFNYSVILLEMNDMQVAQAIVIAYAIAIVVAFGLLSFMVKDSQYYSMLLAAVVVKIIAVSLWFFPTVLTQIYTGVLTLQVLGSLLLLTGLLHAYAEALPEKYRGLGFGLLAVLWLITWAISGFISDAASYYFNYWPFIVTLTTLFVLAGILRKLAHLGKLRGF